MYRLFLIAWFIPCCLSACTFPTDLVGDWYSTTFGTLTFTADSFTGVTAPLSVSPLTFTCHELDGTRYIAKTSTTIFLGLSFDIFLCMNLQQSSPVKFYYTLDSNLLTEFGLRMYAKVTDAATVSATTACNQNDTRHAGEYELLIKKDNVSDAVIACPDGLRSQFNVTEMSTSTTSCNDSETSLDGQTTSQLAFNYSTCAANIAFNAGGTLWCMHYTSDTNIYLTTFNSDSTTDESTKFRFTCITFVKSGSSLSATEYPRVCQANQTATFVEAPGLTYTMTDTVYSQEDDGDVDVGLIVGMVILALIILIIIIVLLWYFLIFRKKRKRRTPKKKPTINEYTANAKRTDSLTGIDKKGSLAVADLAKGTRLPDHVSHYKPANKEKWQDKWEKKMRPRKSIQQAPIVAETSEEPVYSKLSRRNKAKSSLPLDKTTTMTASLPSNLDASDSNGTLSGKTSSLRRSLPDPPTAVESNGDAPNPRLPRFSQDAFSSTHMPESTGKFGGTKKAKSSENIVLPVNTPRLQTIEESTLSREGSSVARSAEKEVKPKPKGIKQVPSFIDTAPPTDVRPVVPDGGRDSRSTLSAKAIVLDERNGTARPRSRITGSNPSIFDDPSWLENNSNFEPEKVFARKANLLPGLPPKENGWLTKGHKAHLTEISRSDMEFNPNNRTKTLIGINSKGLTKIRKRIEEKKKKRKREWMFKWERKQRPQSRKFSLVRRRYRVTPSPTYTFDSYFDTASPQHPAVSSTSSIDESTKDTKAHTEKTARTNDREQEEGTYVNEHSATLNATTKDEENVYGQITEISIKAKSKMDSSNSESKQKILTPDYKSEQHMTSVNAETKEEHHNLEELTPAPENEKAENQPNPENYETDANNANTDNCDTVSIYSGVFYPDDWLYDDEEKAVDRCWSAGSRGIPSTPRNDSKLWCSMDEEHEVTERQFTQEMYHIMQYPVRKKRRYGRWRKEEEVEYHVMHFKDEERKKYM